MPALHTENLSIGYVSKGKSRVVQSGLNLNIQEGELICMIGPNGAGKSTLLKTLGCLQKPISGKIFFENKEVIKLSQRERARYISLVLTDKVDIENAVVHQIVALGRQPYSNWWGTIGEKENELIDEAISMVHLEDMVQNNFNELSDGEKQRVMIAKALAQDTPVIMLDEPTAHLDLPNRVEMMLLLHKLAHKTGKAILLSTHELDLALQAADRIWLMTDNNGIECGVPEDLVFNGSFNNAFKSSAFVFNSANGNFSLNYSMSKKVKVTGDKTRMYWTLRALARKGIEVTEEANDHIEISDSKWIYKNEEFFKLEMLLEKL